MSMLEAEGGRGGNSVPANPITCANPVFSSDENPELRKNTSKTIAPRIPLPMWKSDSCNLQKVIFVNSCLSCGLSNVGKSSDVCACMN